MVDDDKDPLLGFIIDNDRLGETKLYGWAKLRLLYEDTDPASLSSDEKDTVELLEASSIWMNEVTLEWLCLRCFSSGRFLCLLRWKITRGGFESNQPVNSRRESDMVGEG